MAAPLAWRAQQLTSLRAFRPAVQQWGRRSCAAQHATCRRSLAASSDGGDMAGGDGDGGGDGGSELEDDMSGLAAGYTLPPAASEQLDPGLYLVSTPIGE